MSRDTFASNLLIALYHHPERYPPTLNAVQELSRLFKHITLVFRNTNESTWIYPENVSLKNDGSLLDSAEQAQLPLRKKILLFIHFCWHLRTQVLNSKSDGILIYDSMALLAFFCIRWSMPKLRLKWYHSHDLAVLATVRKFSISWWAALLENSGLQQMHIFTLPAQERKAFFKLENFKGKVFFLPNLPSLHFYGQFYQPKKAPKDQLNLLYQGAVSADHGLAEIIMVLNQLELGMPVHLTIIGPIQKKYQEELTALAEAQGVADQVHFLGRIPYQDLPTYTRTGHIGLGILTNFHNDNHTTAATASNKIYEYAALGLPVLYFDKQHFKQHLQEYAWAFGTNLSRESLQQVFSTILRDYEKISACAHADFTDHLYFEYHFSAIKTAIVSHYS